MVSTLVRASMTTYDSRVIRGREIRWTSEGLEYEPDPKHVQILLSEWQLEGCREVVSPERDLPALVKVRQRNAQAQQAVCFDL